MLAVTQRQAGRSVRPAWLWLVAVLLLGVAWMHGLQCSDGMAMIAAVPATNVQLSAEASTGLAGPTIIRDGGKPAGVGGELLGACLTLLVGVLGVMLLDHHRARRLIAVVLAAARPRHRARVLVRAPTLAQLCLLRT